jgi:serine/threonine protein kinase
MRSLTDSQWDRVWEIADQLRNAESQQQEAQLRLLGEQEENSDVLSLVALQLRLPPEDQPDRTGQKIDHFTLIEQLSVGGMGVVYRAQQDVPQREVLVKLIHPLLAADDAVVRRFQDEIEVLGNLAHRGIARIYQGGIHTDPPERGSRSFPYYAMEFVHGVPITTYQTAQSLAPSKLLRLFIEVCMAVDYAHERKVVHCDLKPEHILIDARGLPRVLDFGLARLFDPSLPREARAFLSGTPAYMSPEQVTGDYGNIGFWTDIYALGLILYQLLCGHRPYEVPPGSLTAIRSAIVNTVPPKLGTLNRTCRNKLQEIIAKAIHKNPQERYQTIAAFAEALRGHIEKVEQQTILKNALKRIQGGQYRYSQPLDEISYLKHLKAHILRSDPPWAPNLYTELRATEKSSRTPAIWSHLISATIARPARTVESLLSEVRSHARPVVITGPPGSGKSVLLRQVALTLIDEALADNHPPILPVLVDLKHYRDDVPAIDFLKQHLTVQEDHPCATALGSHFEDLLQEGRLVLLLDGMDEMRTYEYSKRLERLKELTRQFPANRFIFTCRERDYDRSFDVDELAIQALTDEQIDDFIRRSYSHESKPCPKELRPAALHDDRPELLDACRNPFILRMVVTYHVQRGSLPDHIRELYDVFISHLILRKARPQHEVRACRRLLARIAIQITNQEGLGVHIDLDTVRKAGVLATEDDWLAYRVCCESGILREDSQAVHFVHHRLQEYFAALAIDDEFQSNPEVLSRQVDNIWAEQTLTALVSISHSPDAIIHGLLVTRDRRMHVSRAMNIRRLFLVASCVATVKSAVSRDLVAAIVAEIEGAAHDDYVPNRVKALRVLTQLDPGKAMPLLLKHAADDNSPWVRETSNTCLHALRLRGWRIDTKLSTSWWKRFVPVGARGSEEEWRPFKFVFSVQAMVTIAFLTVFAVIGWLRADYREVLPTVGGMFMISYILTAYLWHRFVYEWQVYRQAGLATVYVGRWILDIAILLALTVCNVVLLRPVPFVFVVVATVFSVMLVNNYFFPRWKRFCETSDRVNPQWVTFLQFIPVLGFSFLYIVIGFSTLEETEWFVSLTVPVNLVLLVAAVVALLVADWATVRWLLVRSRNQVVGDRCQRSLVAFAHAEGQCMIGFYHSLTAVVRRRAILSLGHLPYHADVMKALAWIGEKDGAPFVRDAACQAVDEIQQRQRRAGRVEGLDVSPRYPRSGDLGLESRFLFVMGFFLVVWLSFSVAGAALSGYGVELVRQISSPGAPRAFLLSRLGQDRSAVEIYEECLKNGEQPPAVLNALARIRLSSSDLRVRDPQAAIKCAESAVKIDRERNPYYLYTLGQAYYEVEMRQEAAEALERAIQLAPTDKLLQIRRDQYVHE